MLAWRDRRGSGQRPHHLHSGYDADACRAATADEFVPDDLDGLSIIPTLLGDPDRQERHDYLYWEWDQRGSQRAVRRGRWKLVSDKPGVWQVFDLETDISESNDIAFEHLDLIANGKAWIEENRTAPISRR